MLNQKLRRKSVQYVSEILSDELTNSQLDDIIEKLELDPNSAICDNKTNRWRNLIKDLNGTGGVPR